MCVGTTPLSGRAVTGAWKGSESLKAWVPSLDGHRTQAAERGVGAPGCSLSAQWLRPDFTEGQTGGGEGSTGVLGQGQSPESGTGNKAFCFWGWSCLQDGSSKGLPGARCPEPEKHLETPGQSHLEMPKELYLEMPGQSHLGKPCQPHLEMPGQSHLGILGQSYQGTPGQSHLETPCQPPGDTWTVTPGDTWTATPGDA